MKQRKLKKISSAIFLPTMSKIFKRISKALILLGLILALNAIEANALALDDEATAKGKPEKAQYAPDEVIVKFKENIDPISVLLEELHISPKMMNINKVHSIKPPVNKFKKSGKLKKDKNGFYLLKGKKYKDIKEMPDDEIFKEAYKYMGKVEKALFRTYKIKIYDKKGMTLEDIIARLKNNPDVENAQPNYIVRTLLAPEDPYYSSQRSWGQTYDDLWGIKKLQCQDAWDLTQGEGAVVAVIDTGVDYTHPDLTNNIWINNGEIPNNGIDDDGNGFIDDRNGYDFSAYDGDPMDENGHGTHVAGIIAAAMNEEGVVGVAPKTKIMIARGLNADGAGYTEDMAQAVKYAADSGADILSNSWGAPYFIDAFFEIKDAFQYAFDKGCVSVAAAGNSNIDTSLFIPAGLDTVIAVAASTQIDEKCSFSNYGSKVSVSAPGGGYENENGNGNDDKYNILSTMPDNSTIANEKPNLKVSNGYWRLAGTSMACPYVSGVAALILSRNPGLSNEIVKQVIEASSDDIGTPGKDDYFGYGRANAYKAVDMNVDIALDPALKESFLKGVKEITGTASGNVFQGYELLLIPEDSPDDKILLISSTSPVRNGLLHNWDTTAHPDGSYQLTLKTVINNKEIFLNVPINIDNVNDPPVISPISDKEAPIRIPIEFKVETNDPDDPQTAWGQLEYSAENLPAGATFDSETGSFSWTPQDDDLGIHDITFIVKDSEYTIRRPVRITVFYIDFILEEFPVCTERSMQRTPDVYGDRIVWEDWRPDNTNNYIYMYDFSTRTEVPVDTSSSYKYWPKIYKDRIIWIEGGVGICVYDIPTKTRSYISATPINIAIYEDKIVWSQYISENERSIYMYDLTAKKTVPISVDPVSYKSWPVIYEEKIVWVDKRNGNFDIYMYDLLTKMESVICDDPSYQTTPSIYGDKIVWSDDRNGTWDVYMYDLSSSTETRITPDASDQRWPRIYEDKIVYSDFRRLADGGDIYMYDISQNKEIPICAFDRYQARPAYNQGTVVWEDQRNLFAPAYFFNIDIFMAKIAFNPKITSVNPSRAFPGSIVTITGKYFGAAQENSIIKFNGLVLPAESWSDKIITFKAPLIPQAGILEIITPQGKTEGFPLSIVNLKLTLPFNSISINENEELEFNILVEEFYGGISEISVSGLPQGAAFTDSGDNTASFNWIPAFNQAGSYNVTFTAENDSGERDEEILNIVVKNTLVWGTIYEKISPTDVQPSQGALVELLNLEKSQAFASAITNDGGRFDLMNDSISDGTYWIRVSKEGLNSYEGMALIRNTQGLPFSITLSKLPALSPIGNKSVDEGDVLLFSVSATDPDGYYPVILSAEGLPQGANFIDNGDGTGNFNWIPTPAQAGSYEVNFVVEDAEGLKDEESITITANNVLVKGTIYGKTAPNPPQPLQGALVSVLSLDKVVTYATMYTDSSGRFKIKTNPFIPIPDGEYIIKVSRNTYVSYLQNVSLNNNQLLTFDATLIYNRKPEFSLSTIYLQEGTTDSRAIIATDADGDPLSFSASGLPEGATFIDNHNGTATVNFSLGYNMRSSYTAAISVSDPYETVSKSWWIYMKDIIAEGNVYETYSQVYTLSSDFSEFEASELVNIAGDYVRLIRLWFKNKGLIDDYERFTPAGYNFLRLYNSFKVHPDFELIRSKFSYNWGWLNPDATVVDCLMLYIDFGYIDPNQYKDYTVDTLSKIAMGFKIFGAMWDPYAGQDAVKDALFAGPEDTSYLRYNSAARPLLKMVKTLSYQKLNKDGYAYEEPSGLYSALLLLLEKLSTLHIAIVKYEKGDGSFSDVYNAVVSYNNLINDDITSNNIIAALTLIGTGEATKDELKKFFAIDYLKIPYPTFSEFAFRELSGSDENYLGEVESWLMTKGLIETDGRFTASGYNFLRLYGSFKNHQDFVLMKSAFNNNWGWVDSEASALDVLILYANSGYIDPSQYKDYVVDDLFRIAKGFNLFGAKWDSYCGQDEVKFTLSTMPKESTGYADFYSPARPLFRMLQTLSYKKLNRDGYSYEEPSELYTALLPITEKISAVHNTIVKYEKEAGSFYDVYSAITEYNNLINDDITLNNIIAALTLAETGNAKWEELKEFLIFDYTKTRPLKDVWVNIYSPDTMQKKSMYTIKTDSNGSFKITLIPYIGQYIVSFAKNGYRIYEREEYLKSDAVIRFNVNLRSFPEKIPVKERKGEIIIDGIPDEDAWDKAETFTLYHIDKSPDLTSCKVKMLWDQWNLYVAFDVSDTGVENADVPWNSDSVSCSVNNGALSKNRADAGDSGEGSAEKKLVLKSGTTLNNKYDLDSGFTAEMKIPWSSAGDILFAGDEVPFDILSVDHDNNPWGTYYNYNTRFSKISWDGDGNIDTTKRKIVLLGEDPLPKIFPVKKLRNNIFIDGMPNEADWNNAESLTLLHKLSSDGSLCKVKMLWDNEYLYVSFNVKDTQVENANFEWPWDSDSVSCSVNNGILSKNRADVGGTGEGQAERAVAFSRRTTLNNNSDIDLGFMAEMKIPWSSAGAIPAVGDEVPCDVLSVDHDNNPGSSYDDPDTKFSKVFWDSDGNIDETKRKIVLWEEDSTGYLDY